MQFFTIASVLASVAVALALPGGPGSGGDTSYVPCTGDLYSNAQCCAVDVLGVADLNCATRKFSIHLGIDKVAHPRYFASSLLHPSQPRQLQRDLCRRRQAG
jgi:hypothetical protein